MRWLTSSIDNACDDVSASFSMSASRSLPHGPLVGRMDAARSRRCSRLRRRWRRRQRIASRIAPNCAPNCAPVAAQPRDDGRGDQVEDHDDAEQRVPAREELRERGRRREVAVAHRRRRHRQEVARVERCPPLEEIVRRAADAVVGREQRRRVRRDRVQLRHRRRPRRRRDVEAGDHRELAARHAVLEGGRRRLLLRRHLLLRRCKRRRRRRRALLDRALLVDVLRQADKRRRRRALASRVRHRCWRFSPIKFVWAEWLRSWAPPLSEFTPAASRHLCRVYLRPPRHKNTALVYTGCYDQATPAVAGRPQRRAGWEIRDPMGCWGARARALTRWRCRSWWRAPCRPR